MQPEHTRQERLAGYTAYLRERFQTGLLAELQGLPQWVVWKAELDREKKPKKAPYNPNYRSAYVSVKIPKSWGMLDQALTALATGLYSGIGLMITTPLVFLDLDHSVSKETGDITDPKEQEIVHVINSYTEVSPSDTGLHILLFGTLPGKNVHTAIEMYGKERFTMITTNHLKQTPVTIEHRQEAIDDLYHRFALPQPNPPFQNTRGRVDRGKLLHELPPEAEGSWLLKNSE